MIVLLAEIEIEILTRQIQTGGPGLLQTALMTTRPEEATTALETVSPLRQVSFFCVLGAVFNRMNVLM